MYQLNKILVAISIFLLVGCGSVVLVPHKDTVDTNKQAKEQRKDSIPTILLRPDCEECSTVPKSGSNRDLRKGYYFDPEDGRCKEFWYSTGAGCTPPPFKTLDQCINCCGR